MHLLSATNPDTRHRFAAGLISHGVWLCCRCCLSCRDGEELLAARGVLLT